MYDELKEILETTFKVPAADISPDARLTDLELDSLDIVELALAIEQRLRVRITDDELIELERIDAVVARLRDRATKVP